MWPGRSANVAVPLQPQPIQPVPHRNEKLLLIDRQLLFDPADRESCRIGRGVELRYLFQIDEREMLPVHAFSPTTVGILVPDAETVFEVPDSFFVRRSKCAQRNEISNPSIGDLDALALTSRSKHDLDCGVEVSRKRCGQAAKIVLKFAIANDDPPDGGAGFAMAIKCRHYRVHGKPGN